jgi:hypothetical protein
MASSTGTNTVSYAETLAIEAFLGYLHKNYSKSINAKDQFLILAVASWFHQESGGLSRVIGNNPFNIRTSPLQSGTRKSKGNGHFAVFASMAKGFEAAAYLLMHGGHGAGAKDLDSYGYRLALNALKHGGNQAANDFLAALAMSKWDAAHYGAATWADAYDPKKNHLLRVYMGWKYVQTKDPHPKPKKEPPPLPQDFNYKVVVRNYLDPWAARDRYVSRGRRQAVDAGVKRR